MTILTKSESPRKKIAALPDDRLQALAFRAWRATHSQDAKKRERANQLSPLFKAELKLRKQAGATN